MFKRLGQVFLLQHVGLVHGERLPVGVPRDDIIVRIVRHHVPRLPAQRFRIPSRVSPSVRAHSFIHSFARARARLSLASRTRFSLISSPPRIVSSVSVSTHHKNGDTDIVANGVVRFPDFPLPPPDFADMSSFLFVSAREGRRRAIASRVAVASRVRSRSPTRGRSNASRSRLGRVSRARVSRGRGRAARSDEGRWAPPAARETRRRRAERREARGRMDAWRDACASMDARVMRVWNIGGRVDAFCVYPRWSASRAATPRPSSKSRACSRMLLETSSAVVFLP